MVSIATVGKGNAAEMASHLLEMWPKDDRREHLFTSIFGLVFRSAHWFKSEVAARSASATHMGSIFCVREICIVLRAGMVIVHKDGPRISAAA